MHVVKSMIVLVTIVAAVAHTAVAGKFRIRH